MAELVVKCLQPGNSHVIFTFCTTVVSHNAKKHVRYFWPILANYELLANYEYADTPLFWGLFSEWMGE